MSKLEELEMREKEGGEGGALPSGTGLPMNGAAKASPPSRVGIPSAVTISGELYAFLMGEGPLEGVWFGEMNDAFKGAFWWRALLRCAAGWPASGIEARSGETPAEAARCEAQEPDPKGDAHDPLSSSINRKGE